MARSPPRSALLGDRSDRLAPRRQARSARWPTTCSTGSRGRSRSCRRSTSTTRAAPSCSTASASCPSTTRRAPSARSSSARRTRSPRSPAPSSSSSSARAPPPRRACCSTRCTPPARCAATCRSTSPSRWCATARGSSTREYPGLQVHGVIGDFERHLDRVPPAEGPRIVAFLGGTIGNFPPGSRRRFLRQIATSARPRGPPADGHRPGQGPERAGGRLRRRRRASPPSSTATCCSCSTASWTPTSTPSDFEHVALFDREHEWIEMRLRARPRASPRWSATWTSTCTSTRARSCAPRSAPSSRPSGCDGDLAAAGLELAHWLTDPEELFALTLSRAHSACRLPPSMQIEGATAIVVGGASGPRRGDRARAARARRDRHDRRRQRREGRRRWARSSRPTSSPATCARRPRSRRPSARGRAERARCASRSAAPGTGWAQKVAGSKGPHPCCPSRRSSRST